MTSRFQYSMTVTDGYGNDGRKRQLAEDINIQEKDKMTLMNRQDGWRQIVTSRSRPGHDLLVQ